MTSLTIESIEERYNDDIAKFILAQNQIQNDDNFIVPDLIKKKKKEDDLAAIIKKIFDEMFVEMLKLFVYDDPARFNYRKLMKEKENIDDIAKKQLWIYRTFIFYQLFVVLILVIENNELFNKIIGDRINFEDGVFDELEHCQLGIYGSINVTSDIDVGIRFINYNNQSKPILFYLVHIYEELFLVYFQKNTLDFDIEPYADMYVLNYDKKDHFFNTTHLTELPDDLQKLAFASIWRNILLMDNKIEPSNLHNFIQTVCIKLNVENYSLILNGILEENSLNENLFAEGRNLAMGYMNLKNYDKKRQAYYKNTLVAEKEIIKYIKTPNQQNDLNIVVNLIYLIGMSLLFREESYVCVPTIMHIVNMGQAAKEHVKTKYKDILNKQNTQFSFCNEQAEYEKSNPLCNMNEYGIVLSILEQMGYLYRFKDSQEKVNKYISRLISGIDYYTVLKEIQNGGIRSILKNKKRHLSKKTRKAKKAKKTKRVKKAKKARKTKKVRRIYI